MDGRKTITIKRSEQPSKENTLERLSFLKSEITKLIRSGSKKDLPKVFHLSEGIGFPKYKITVELIEEDFFFDSHGTKWIREKT